MNISERIAYIRKKAFVTQTEFAASIGVTQNWVSQLESCRKTPGRKLVERICSEYNVEKDWLAYGIGNPGDIVRPKINIEEVLLTVSDVADVLRVCAPTAQKWIKSVGLRTIKVGNQVRIRKEDLEKALSE